DSITAGERIGHGLKPYDTKSFYKDYPKMSALGKMLQDHTYALDALSEAKRVDSARIGVIGHGLGGCNALFAAAFDERVQVCVASGGFTRFADDKEPQRWASEEGFVYWPQLREVIKKREFAFDWEHILALCAPSPTLILTALNDPSLSNTKSCEKAGKLAKGVYKLLGASDALTQVSHSDGDDLSPDVIIRADDWFERWL
ncbi:MAG: prolyl oligopeptidase family serine peptidase, partial [Candidatus Hydrogenedentes bacterium]|nr:prolyl oligopeptidase family serine peptidase [Candidatus Hydrogenedentota bacterium]